MHSPNRPAPPFAIHRARASSAVIDAEVNYRLARETLVREMSPTGGTSQPDEVIEYFEAAVLRRARASLAMG